MIETYYSIHGIVNFKIVNTGFMSWRFNNIHGSFENFETEKIIDLDFIVNLGKFKPSSENCKISDGKYYIKDDYFYCKNDSYKFTRWEFELIGIDNGPTIVNINSNTLGYLWMCGFIIEFLIHYKMNNKGYPIIHASGVAKDGKAILFSARGGGGKTTIALNLADRGYTLLGDNFVILHNGKVLSYISPLNIFTYNMTPLVSRNLGAGDKAILALKAVLYRLTLGYIKIFSKVNLKKIAPGSVIDEAALETIMLIIPKENINPEPIETARLCDHLVMNQKLDTLLFLQYLLEYSYVFPYSGLSMHWSRYRQNLEKCLEQNVNFSKLEIMRKYDEKAFDRIMEIAVNSSV